MFDIRKRVIPVALVFLSFCSCQKLESGPAGSAIRINVVGNLFTKSSDVTTDFLKTSGKFVLDAYLDDPAHDIINDPSGTNPAYDINQNYIVSNGSYNVTYSTAGGWQLTTSHKWVAGDLTRFFCYYPDKAALNSAAKGLRTIADPGPGTNIMEFSYKLPTPVSGKDADNQHDLVFAYAQKNYGSSATGDVIDIAFHHALSKINFCVSPDDGTFDSGLTIEDISIMGVAGTGNCEFHGDGSIAENSMFIWSDQTDISSYSQDYNASFSGTKTKDWENTSLSGGKEKRTCLNSFFMIPQTLSGAKLKVTFSNSEESFSKAVTADIPDVVWRAGKYYTYKISATSVGRDIKATVTLESWDNFDDKLYF